MILERTTFLKFMTYALLGFVFYYASIFLGLFGNSIIIKILAVTFLLVTIPLPTALMNSRMFPEIKRSGKLLLAFGAVLLIFHHFLLSFIVVLLIPGNSIG